MKMAEIVQSLVKVGYFLSFKFSIIQIFGPIKPYIRFQLY